ncbi:MAG: hypothetical protein JOZ10_17365 [Acidobacteria bacterium]|nr:hypothetical protein [Acidobacteriota bacterium]
MTHVSEQDLVLYFYGDADKPALLEQHLADCPECSAEFARLRTTLSAIDFPVPERAPEYEAQLWSTLRPRLQQADAPKRSFWSAALQPRRWAIAGALAAIVVAAFLAGRYLPRGKEKSNPEMVQKAPARSGGDRVLMVAVGDHLDRTEMVLVELVNARAEGKVDISAERGAAQELVNSNRLYRETAQHDKDPELASMLDQVERVLVDIAHHPDSVSGKELEELQQHIESQGILFKVRVVESKVKARSRPESAGATKKETSSTL